MSYQRIILHLNLIVNIGPAIIIKLVELIGLNNLDQIYQYSVLNFIKLGVPEVKAQILFDGLADKKLLEKELDLIAVHQVQVVTYWCPEYSHLLSEIHVPPVVLYCQGNIGLLRSDRLIACVGSRKAHIYALEAIKMLIGPMAQDGWVIVSGGATGADRYAHELALNLGRATIVVVGSGLCHQYPPSNRDLFSRVLQEGSLMVSTFPMNRMPDNTTFPIRNRIISGLSLGCLVVQAAAKSGALITAQQALDQDREVFAVPGSILDPLSAGCHDLIKQGAKIVSCHEDILEEFTMLIGQKQIEDSDGQLTVFADTKEKKSTFVGYRTDSLEHKVLTTLVVPMSADRLMQKISVNLFELQSVLFNLSLEGLISQNETGFWSLK